MRVEVHRHHARRMRPVHERVDAPAVELADERRHRAARSAVGEVTWLTSANRVLGVTASRYASTTCAGSWMGNGIRAMTTRAPSRSAAARRALSVALYSWSPASSSSPGLNRSDARTVDTPVVALGDEREAVRVGAQERGDLGADRVEQRLELAVEEADGLGLESVAPGPLGLEHGRRGTRRTTRG